MSADPRILYIILVLPSLFGITLIVEGISKIIHDEWWGLVSIIFGMLFIGLVIVVYFLFTAHLK